VNLLTAVETFGLVDALTTTKTFSHCFTPNYIGCRKTLRVIFQQPVIALSVFPGGNV